MKKAAYAPAELNEGFVVAITIEAQPGKGDEMAKVLQGLVGPTMDEPGVKLFMPYRSPSNPLLFFIYELYLDETAWAAHQATPHFLAAKPLLTSAARRERVPFVPFV
jgi:quinol monooxygenase YgiN